jgi:hypothetical protein
VQLKKKKYSPAAGFHPRTAPVFVFRIFTLQCWQLSMQDLGAEIKRSSNYKGLALYVGRFITSFLIAKLFADGGEFAIIAGRTKI